MPLTHPIPIPMIAEGDDRSSTSLQSLIDRWSDSGRLGLSHPPPELVYLHLQRYRVDNSVASTIEREITNLDEVLFPITQQSSRVGTSSHSFSGDGAGGLPYRILGLI